MRKPSPIDDLHPREPLGPGEFEDIHGERFTDEGVKAQILADDARRAADTARRQNEERWLAGDPYAVPPDRWPLPEHGTWLRDMIASSRLERE